MNRRPKRAALAATLAFSLATSTGAAAAARPSPQPMVTQLASFGSGLGSGSTIGPDGAVYVTDGNAGSVLRVDPCSGTVSTYATGLPTQVIGIGGAMDVAFLNGTAFVLVTLVGGDLLLPGGPVHFGDAVDGIYRLAPDGTFTVIADIGAWSAAHPPTTDFFITTGVQYALQPYRGGFIVTDGHHNRLLRVGLDGNISQLQAFANVAPTGLEAWGNTLFMAEAGPVPHQPQSARVVAVDPKSSTVLEVGSGTGVSGPGLTVDVERGPGHTLYALLQGVWTLPPDPGNAGQPASPNTGALVRIDNDGSFVPVVTGLDRPTSLEFSGNTAFVTTLTGTVVRIDHVAARRSEK